VAIIFGWEIGIANHIKSPSPGCSLSPDAFDEECDASCHIEGVTFASDLHSIQEHFADTISEAVICREFQHFIHHKPAVCYNSRMQGDLHITRNLDTGRMIIDRNVGTMRRIYDGPILAPTIHSSGEKSYPICFADEEDAEHFIANRYGVDARGCKVSVPFDIRLSRIGSIVDVFGTVTETWDV
jgi:hypothetical protein